MTRSRVEPDYSIEELRSGEMLAEFIHRVGHEIGNPLTSIISLSTILLRLFPREQFPSADALLPGSPPRGGEAITSIQPKLEQYANSILDEAWRINGLNQRMVLLLSSRPGQSRPCEPAFLLRRALGRVQRSNEFNPELVRVNDLTNREVVFADPDQFQILGAELVQNALEAAHEVDPANPPPIDVVIAREKERLAITISNREKQPIGPNLSSIFRPFVSSRSYRHLGLGLPVAYAIVKRLGGSIAVVEELLPEGPRFSVSLELPLRGSRPCEFDGPVKDGAHTHPDRSETDPRAVAALPSSLTILLIDDEASVVSAVEKLLVLGLGGETTLRFLRAVGCDAFPMLDNEPQIDLVLCDLRLHGTSGLNIYEHVLKTRPALRSRFVFLTGDGAQLDEEMYIATSGCPCLPKPFEAEKLLETVRRVVTTKSPGAK